MRADGLAVGGRTIVLLDDEIFSFAGLVFGATTMCDRIVGGDGERVAGSGGEFERRGEGERDLSILLRTTALGARNDMASGPPSDDMVAIPPLLLPPPLPPMLLLNEPCRVAAKL